MALSGGSPRRRRARGGCTSDASSGAISTRPTAIGIVPASRTPWRREKSWQWFRSRILGGRTNHYGRISLRFSDYDFQA